MRVCVCVCGHVRVRVWVGVFEVANTPPLHTHTHSNVDDCSELDQNNHLGRRAHEIAIDGECCCGHGVECVREKMSENGKRKRE